MKRSARRSFDAGRLVCPSCGDGELQTRGKAHGRCDRCEETVDGPVVQALLEIVALPDALGCHACDCGHPEMRRLPGGIYRCAACCAEILPVDARE